ncbi:hypothetical protein ACFCVO_08600 [Agromyces sp. NPDC056379]|uniref:hypothetical protein n=1 Tax=unclassified Agromyces TaxID=2639701 RepID=UPI0035E03361
MTESTGATAGAGVQGDRIEAGPPFTNLDDDLVTISMPRFASTDATPPARPRRRWLGVLVTLGALAVGVVIGRALR